MKFTNSQLDQMVGELKRKPEAQSIGLTDARYIPPTAARKGDKFRIADVIIGKDGTEHQTFRAEHAKISKFAGPEFNLAAMRPLTERVQ